MFLEFEKWQGCANDFVVLWISDRDGDVVLGSLKRQATKICDRHLGVGADGLLILHTKTPEDLMPYKLTIVNSDGSVAQNCGNGIRCAGLSVRRRYDEVTNDLPEVVELDVEGQPKIARFFDNKIGAYPYVAVDMGTPILGEDLEWSKAAIDTVNAIAKENRIDVSEVFTASVSNPHVIIQVAEASREIMLKFGPALQSAGPWDGINVHLISETSVADGDQKFAGNAIGGRVSETYLTYVWERGAGETMACGSGACAIGAVVLEQGLTERSDWLAVDMPGGRLYVRQAAADEPVILAGPAVHVFDGKLEI